MPFAVLDWLFNWFTTFLSVSLLIVDCSFTPFQLLSLLKESLEKQNKLTYDSLYTRAADLLSYLSIKAKSDSKTGKDVEEEKLPQNFCHILKWFWEGFSSICLENLESGSGKVVNILFFICKQNLCS